MDTRTRDREGFQTDTGRTDRPARRRFVATLLGGMVGAGSALLIGANEPHTASADHAATAAGNFSSATAAPAVHADNAGSGDGLLGTNTSNTDGGNGIEAVRGGAGGGYGLLARRTGSGGGSAIFALNDSSQPFGGIAVEGHRSGNGGGYAVWASNDATGFGAGILGNRTGAGGGTGVEGVRSGGGLGHGVYGARADGGLGNGVMGMNLAANNGHGVVGVRSRDGTGAGVRGEIAGRPGNIAVWAVDLDSLPPGSPPNNPPPPGPSIALRVDGRSRFSTVGTGSVASGADMGSVADLRATPTSHITVTLTSDPGKDVALVWVERAAGKFTIHLNRKASAPIGFTYFIVEPV